MYSLIVLIQFKSFNSVERNIKFRYSHTSIEGGENQIHTGVQSGVQYIQK